MALRKPKVELSLRARALKMLARREHSRLELQRKLAAYPEDAAEIVQVMDDFERRGWLSERRWVDQVLVIRQRRYGAQRITRELREKGASEEELTRAREQLKSGELETARAIYLRKFDGAPDSANERARRMRFLQGRGFSSDVIRRVLSGRDE